MVVACFCSALGSRSAGAKGNGGVWTNSARGGHAGTRHLIEESDATGEHFFGKQSQLAVMISAWQDSTWFVDGRPFSTQIRAITASAGAVDAFLRVEPCCNLSLSISPCRMLY